jgi:hypothetical protein
MKKRNIYLLTVTLVILSLSISSLVQAQPPNPPGSHGSNGSQGAGGAAPIDGGVTILLLSSIGYGGYKLVRKLRVK